MEEKMKGLDKLISGVNDYCNENGIEYLFAAVAGDGDFVKLSHNTLTNAVLKESAKVVQLLLTNPVKVF